MNRLITCLALVLITNMSYEQALPHKISEESFSIGKSIRIASVVLDEERELNIYLPQSYSSAKSKSYPVIYLLDGSRDEDFIHISGLVQFGSFSWIQMIPESIVVGIANVDRKRDFTFPSSDHRDQKEFPTSGGSADFINFIEAELQPFIETNFRTSSDKTIIGQSLGGLLATEVLFNKPQLFDNYIIVSPSLWWSDEELLQAKPVEIDSNKSIYIAGGKEGAVMERTAKELYNKLQTHNSKNIQLHYEFMADKTHGDALHIGVYHAFERLFNKSDQ